MVAFSALFPRNAANLYTDHTTPGKAVRMGVLNSKVGERSSSGGGDPVGLSSSLAPLDTKH